MGKVIIFGKDDCPYTTAARRDYTKRNVPFVYKDVGHDLSALNEMRLYVSNDPRVPVIVENGRVQVGYQGGT